MVDHFTEDNRLGNPFGRRISLDSLSNLILQTLQDAVEPLETKDIENRCKYYDDTVTRVKIFYRLQNLRAEGQIKGKFIGSGKGNWIWWTHKSPSNYSNFKRSRGDVANG